MISGVLPVKNGLAFIADSMPRILQNLDSTDELIIIDDNSTDHSSRLLLGFQAIDPRIRILSNNSDGLVSALNLGFREAKNDWVARFDIDDKYPPNRLQRQKLLFADNISAIFSDYRVVSDFGRVLGTIRSPIYPENTRLSLIHSQRTCHPSAIINKRAFMDVGGYRQSDFPAEDLSLWLRLSNGSQIVSIGETLIDYTLRKKSTSQVMRSLIHSKRSKLIKSNSPKYFLDDSLLDFDFMLSLYNSDSFPKERLLLSLYDLSHSWIRNSLSYSEKRIIRNLFLKTARSLDGMSSLSQLISNRIKRRLWRLYA